jgi:hypothetical protein
MSAIPVSMNAKMEKLCEDVKVLECRVDLLGKEHMHLKKKVIMQSFFNAAIVVAWGLTKGLRLFK